jgi:hypothetical protein
MQSFTAELLHANGDCELPCWWGITPGVTEWEDMEDFFLSHGVQVADDEVVLRYNHPHIPRPVRIEFDFERQDDLVQGIQIHTSHRSVLSGTWQLEQVLSRYGQPSRVELELNVGAPSGAGFTPYYVMWVVYDGLGAAISYSGKMESDVSGWLVCPAPDQAAGLTRIRSVDREEELLSVESQEPFVLAGTWQEQTGMSLDTFHAAFGGTGSPTCSFVADPDPWREGLYLPEEADPLSPEEEDAAIARMLAGDGGCELPCWWGLTPGVTGWEEARQQFLDHGKALGSMSPYSIAVDEGRFYRADFFHHHARYPFAYRLNHMLYQQDGIVHVVGVIGSSYEDSPLRLFTEDWQHYNLQEVLARYGRPTQVVLRYWSIEGGDYTVGLLYEERGLMFEYGGEIPITGEVSDIVEPIEVCLGRERVRRIGVWARSAQAQPSLYTIFDRVNHPVDPPTLEEATGMTVDTFYNTYLQDSDVCLEADPALGYFSQ